MPSPLILKTDFAEFVDVPANLPDAKIVRYIVDAELFDLKPALNSKALYANLKSLPAVDDSTDLWSFYNVFVKPFLVYSAFCRFELRHGVNVTQYGMRENTETTSEAISDKRRGELLADDRSKRNVYLSVLLKELADQRRTFDGVIFTEDDAPRKNKQSGNSWNIRAVSPGRDVFGDGYGRDRIIEGPPSSGNNDKVDYDPGDYN
jgi:hypothetical protein